MKTFYSKIYVNCPSCSFENEVTGKVQARCRSNKKGMSSIICECGFKYYVCRDYKSGFETKEY